MTALTITTFDWVPDFARGYVRDLRARWACEEAGLTYQIKTVPSANRTAEHLLHQPFHQVPFLQDGDLTLFESGAIVLHLAEKSEALMPKGSRPQVTQWTLAALNSVEPFIMPWLIAKVFTHDEKVAADAEPRLRARLGQLADALGERSWLLDQFTAADILMADALRQLEQMPLLNDYPALSAYVSRAKARPAFRKAHADQLAHFEAAEQMRQSA